MRVGDAIDLITIDLMAVGLPAPVTEYPFAKAIKRRWRFDLAWPEQMIAVEIDGATWTGGRHTSGSGYAKDAEKLNSAVCQGWSVLRFTTTMIREGGAADVIASLFERKKEAE